MGVAFFGRSARSSLRAGKATRAVFWFQRNMDVTLFKRKKRVLKTIDNWVQYKTEATGYSKRHLA